MGAREQGTVLRALGCSCGLYLNAKLPVVTK